jgi:hypothetical protein
MGAGHTGSPAWQVHRVDSGKWYLAWAGRSVCAVEAPGCLYPQGDFAYPYREHIRNGVGRHSKAQPCTQPFCRHWPPACSAWGCVRLGETPVTGGPGFPGGVRVETELKKGQEKWTLKTKRAPQIRWSSA